MSQFSSIPEPAAAVPPQISLFPSGRTTIAGMTLLFVPMVVGMTALTGGGSTNLDGIPTTDLEIPTVFDVLGVASFTRWLLRAKAVDDVASTGEDIDKTLVVPVDDPTLIWERISSAGSADAPSGAVLVDNDGTQLADNDGTILVDNP